MRVHARRAEALLKHLPGRESVGRRVETGLYAHRGGGTSGGLESDCQRQIFAGTNQAGGAMSTGAVIGGGGGSTAPAITHIVASPWQR